LRDEPLPAWRLDAGGCKRRSERHPAARTRRKFTVEAGIRFRSGRFPRFFAGAGDRISSLDFELGPADFIRHSMQFDRARSCMALPMSVKTAGIECAAVSFFLGL
jgi:hypothetical protein